MHVTRGLVDGLLDMAAEREPAPFEADLGLTPAGEFESDLGIPAESPVFTHFYLPDAGASVSAVFGFDLGTGPGQTQGRFLSHPTGQLEVRSTDDLHSVMLIAIPPWDRGSIKAFDQAGNQLPLTVLDVVPPDTDVLGADEQ